MRGKAWWMRFGAGRDVSRTSEVVLFYKEIDCGCSVSAMSENGMIVATTLDETLYFFRDTCECTGLTWVISVMSTNPLSSCTEELVGLRVLYRVRYMTLMQPLFIRAEMAGNWCNGSHSVHTFVIRAPNQSQCFSLSDTMCDLEKNDFNIQYMYQNN